MFVFTMMVLLLHVLMWSDNYSAFAAQGEFIIFFIAPPFYLVSPSIVVFIIIFLSYFIEAKLSNGELAPRSMPLENYLHFNK